MIAFSGALDRGRSLVGRCRCRAWVEMSGEPVSHRALRRQWRDGVLLRPKAKGRIGLSDGWVIRGVFGAVTVVAGRGFVSDLCSTQAA